MPTQADLHANEEVAPNPDCCPQCLTGVLVARHCKLICDQCGYIESCEDIFPAERYIDE